MLPGSGVERPRAQGGGGEGGDATCRGQQPQDRSLASALLAVSLPAGDAARVHPGPWVWDSVYPPVVCRLKKEGEWRGKKILKPYHF